MAKVCVVGSFMMDLVVCAPRRPESGETLIGSDFASFLGGKGFNQAVAAARAGATVSMVGAVGRDDFGVQFLAKLDEEGIDHQHVRVDEGAGTGVGLPLVDARGQNSIVVVPRANTRLSVADIEAAESTIAAADVLLLQLEVPLETALSAARAGRAAGALIVLNPAPPAASLDPFAGLIDVLVPNEHEAEHLSGRSCAAGDGSGAARALMQQTGARAVVVTLGERGALVVDGARTQLVSGLSVPCVDTVGAGDAFCGALVSRLADNEELLEAARYGNAAGALAVTARGAEPAMPRHSETRRLLATASSAPLSVG